MPDREIQTGTTEIEQLPQLQEDIVTTARLMFLVIGTDAIALLALATCFGAVSRKRLSTI